MRLRCNACGGEYDDVLPDGMQYFHVCPPLSVGELEAAVAAGKVQLPAGETAADAVTRRTYERANKRDETVEPSPDRDKPGRPKRAGAGVTRLPDRPSPIVVVP